MTKEQFLDQQEGEKLDQLKDFAVGGEFDEAIELQGECKADYEDSQVSDTYVLDENLISEIDGIPDKLAFKIGEAAQILGIRAYVLRYWESEFDELRPKKSHQNQRMYSRNDVKLAMMIKKLLYKDRFSIEGARKALRKLRSHVKQETEKKVVMTKIEKSYDKLYGIVDDLSRLKLLFKNCP